MKNPLPVVLKYLSIFACFLLPYPLFTLAIYLFTRSSVGLTLWGVLAMEANGFLGCMISLVLNRPKNPIAPVIKNITVIAAGILAGIVTGMIFSYSGIISMVLFFVFSAVCFFCGSRLYYNHYAEILKTMLVLGFAFANLLSLLLIFCLTEKESSATRFLAPLFLLVLLIYALVRNQSNIDQLMERRRHKMEHLPKKIRYYNSILLGIMCLVTLIFFLAKDQIADGIGWIGRELIRLIILVIGAITTLLSSLLGFQKAGTSVPELGDGQFPTAESGAASDFPVGIVLLIIIIVLLILFRKPIINKLREIGGKLAALLKKSGVLQRTEIHSEYYEDYVHTLTDEERGMENGKKDDIDHIRKWKKLYRKYLRVHEPEKRCEMGYRLFLDWLILQHIDIAPHDTTWDILQKGKQHFELLDGMDITEIYNLFLYREDIVSPQQIESLDLFLKQLLTISRL